jgi:hypothetical protein
MIPYKLPLAAVLAAFFFALGWFTKPVPPLVAAKTEVQHEVQVKVVDRVVTKTVTVVERKPNGATKTTRAVEVTQVQARTEGTKDRRSEVVDKLHPNRADKNWSIAGAWEVQRLDTYRPVAAEIGYRVGGPVWVTGSWNWRTHQPLVGLRLEF